MKRIIAFLLLAVMMLSLAACDGSGNKVSLEDFQDGNYTVPKATYSDGSVAKGNFAVPEVGYDGSEVTIKFGHTMGKNLTEVLDYYIGEFNKLYPNITVEHTNYGGWGDIAGLINTEIIGGNQPNIAYCYPDHVAMYNMTKATVILDDLIESKVEVTRADGTTEILGLTDEQIADFIEGFYMEGTAYGDGLMYTMPMSKSTEVLYYNKTYFEKNGLSVPTTWEEMEALCKQLKELDPNCTPLGYDSEDNMFITMCEQYNYGYTSATGEHFLFNNDDCKSFVKEFREWYQAGYITTEALYGAYTSGLFTQLDPAENHSYMCIGSSGGASYQIPEGKVFEVGVAPIPQVSKDNQKVISQGPSLCLLKDVDTSDQEVVASWLFMKFLTTNVYFQGEFSQTSGYMPVLKSVRELDVYADWLAKADGKDYLTAMVVKVGLEQSDNYFTSPAFVGSTVAREQVGSMLAKCMSELTDDADALIESAFEKAYKECKSRAG